MKKKKAESLTLTEIQVLGAIARIGEASSAEVFETLSEFSPRVNYPTVYAALSRMALKGYLATWSGDPQPVRGGRAKNYFKLTGKGSETLSANADEVRGTARMLGAPAFP